MPTDSLPRQLARTRRFTLGAPAAPAVSADGRTVLFLRSRAGDDPVSCLWALDTATGAERLLADPAALGADDAALPEAERIHRERARVLTTGITAFGTDGTGRLAVFALHGALWLVDTADGTVRPVPTAAPVYDPRLDRAGRRIAYVGGGALRVVGTDGRGDRALAEPEHEEVAYGTAEHVAAESMYRTRGHWWSPDGTALLATRVDDRPLSRLHLADPAEPQRRPRTVRYPLAGTANADVSLWLLPLDPDRPGARTEVRWDRAGYEYLTAAGWDDHGPYAAVQSRDQRTVRTLAIAPDGGTSALAEQRDEHWVELVPGLPVRTASGAPVGSADRGGTRHLTVAGQPVTPAGLQLRAVLGTEGEQVLFTATEEPTETHLWLYEPAAGLRRLSEGPGLHTGVRRGGTLVLTTRAAGAPAGRTTVLSEGRPALPLASFAQAPVLTARPELLRLGPRGLCAALFRPTGHRPGDGPLPVLLDPYGGPALQKVTTGGGWPELVSQWFADQGFAVLAVDGRGTPGRGPRWDKEIFGDKATPALEDQVEGLHEAARLRPGLLDLDRVAIRGWSYGGYLAALAVLRRPDVFHAAVAGAAPTDQRLYDTHWQERFLGHPDEYPERYDACSLIDDAPRLRRPLLLVHGLADDNVFPVHALRFSGALLAAGRPHEVLPLSGTTHTPTDEAVAENLHHHQLDFLKRSLGLA
ncbi:prolyl oligopeptidase family serine peptidase [Kitasatospora sp. CM 4170]|uniref:Prolyl oligopeptidase family serine peptidase n=1 Tax=Kitasatospora aburaviensis TaxID=67265 RepID=A0ABW1F3E8_9ACTN|nr:prolyl oligopeptidase family serine peptidase [Kitasatospora sp. CM 4170]WNM46096.1 prolyl oligopeptidase family serine peptidase [Kitasatospora sp. CM 4170]